MKVVSENQACREISDMFPELEDEESNGGKLSFQDDSEYDEGGQQRETRFCKLLRVGVRMLRSGGCGDPVEL